MEKGRIIGGKYRIREALGRGGGGTVYLAEDLRVGTLRAVKRGGRGNAGVFREGEILKKLEHPALPGIVDRLEEEDGVFLVMEYIPGRNLEACLKSHGPFESDRIRAWALELCGILSYLHRQEPPVLYRDLKPSNLILDREGRLHLVDFGIAAEAGETFTPAGSRGYAAPEQFRRGEAQQASTDLYALGVTLYRLAAGRLPEPGKEPRRPGGMSRGMFRVLKKCMRADPEKRFRNCRDLQKALERCREGRISGRKSRKGVRRILLAGAAAVLVWAAGVQEIRSGSRTDYQALLEAFREDGRFTPEEEALLLEKLEQIPEDRRNSPEYRYLAYETGRLYRECYIYGGEEGRENRMVRAAAAAPWFRRALGGREGWTIQAEQFLAEADFYQKLAAGVGQSTGEEGG